MDDSKNSSEHRTPQCQVATLISSAMVKSGLNCDALQRAMVEQGSSVTSATVRVWVSGGGRANGPRAAYMSLYQAHTLCDALDIAPAALLAAAHNQHKNRSS